MPIRGVLLDADGTLWDTHRAMRSAAVVGLRRAFPGLDDGDAEYAAQLFRADPAHTFNRFVRGELTFEQMRAARLAEIAGGLGLVWTDDLPAMFALSYDPAFTSGLRAFEDTAPFLEQCADAGLSVRVLTNSGHRFTDVKVDAAALDSLRGRVCSRDCLGVGKPDPRAFHHACEQMGLEPAEVLFIGDEWTADAQGAADAGLQAVWLVRDDGDPAEEVVATQERRAEAAGRGIPIVRSLSDVRLGP